MFQDVCVCVCVLRGVERCVSAFTSPCVCVCSGRSMSAKVCVCVCVFKGVCVCIQKGFSVNDGDQN